MKQATPSPEVILILLFLFGALQTSLSRSFIDDETCATEPSKEYSVDRLSGDFSESDALTVIITCPPNITVSCANQVPPPDINLVTASSNCGGPVTVIFLSDVISNQICPDIYTITRTYEASDLCGNSATCVQIISVEDTDYPILICPSDVTLTCAASTAPANTGIATAIDGCTSNPTIIFSDMYIPGICTNSGVIQRTFTATDHCGNSASCIQTITIDDTDPPIITCPPNVTLTCTASTAPANTGLATAIDDCTANPVLSHIDNYVPGVCPNSGVIQRTFTATDHCGNSASCIQIISVDDNIPPVISNGPSDITVAAPGTSPCSAYISIGIPIASDACDPNVVIINDYNSTSDASDFYPEGNTPVTFTATDDCGNTSTHLVNITVTCSSPSSNAMVIHSNGNIGISGYTSLGETTGGAPAIKMKELTTATTAATHNSSVSVPHGLTASKILSVSILVEWNVDLFAPPEYSSALNLRYSYFVSATDIVIQNNTPSGDCMICSKPASITIIYKE